MTVKILLTVRVIYSVIAIEHKCTCAAASKNYGRSQKIAASVATSQTRNFGMLLLVIISRRNHPTRRTAMQLMFKATGQLLGTFLEGFLCMVSVYMNGWTDFAPSEREMVLSS